MQLCTATWRAQVPAWRTLGQFVDDAALEVGGLAQEPAGVGDASGPSLLAFTQATTQLGAVVHTDELQSYRALAKHGYDHRRLTQTDVAAGDQLLPRAHRAISNLKAWMHGTHRGVSPEHLAAYLDELALTRPAAEAVNQARGPP
jgi:hypothetical protein